MVEAFTLVGVGGRCLISGPDVSTSGSACVVFLPQSAMGHEYPLIPQGVVFYYLHLGYEKCRHEFELRLTYHVIPT
jgi:hypothetical protein